MDVDPLAHLACPLCHGSFNDSDCRPHNLVARKPEGGECNHNICKTCWDRYLDSLPLRAAQNLSSRAAPKCPLCNTVVYNTGVDHTLMNAATAAQQAQQQIQNLQAANQEQQQIIQQQLRFLNHAAVQQERLTSQPASPLQDGKKRTPLLNRPPSRLPSQQRGVPRLQEDGGPALRPQEDDRQDPLNIAAVMNHPPHQGLSPQTKRIIHFIFSLFMLILGVLSVTGHAPTVPVFIIAVGTILRLVADELHQ